ncbi:hypothetical protein HHI36_020364 [Cryptolaemus montrouzieri]|uniref:Uncharacterized protein n=1 Tax=Cryptolaemus montrouzieri TaxID=559131 RepID=A0ABD2NAB2_9CUCU
MNLTVQHIKTLLSVLRCLNLIIQNYTSVADLIAVIGKENYLTFPVIQLDIYQEEVIWYFYPSKPDVYVIIHLSEEQFSKTMEYLSDEISFNPAAKYILIMSNLSSTISSLLNSYFILNVVLMDSESKKLFTYYPYRNNIFNSIHTELVELGTCGENGDVHLKSELFQQKIPKVWKDSMVSIMYYPCYFYTICHECKSKGVEIEIFNVIAEYLNIKLKFHRVHNLSIEISHFYKKRYDIFLVPKLYKII